MSVAMHELSLARDLLNAAERALGPNQPEVLRLKVSVGAASGIVLESLHQAFAVLAKGTRLAGADLALTIVPARSRCARCSMQFEFDGMLGTCPACGQLGGQLLSGDEIILRAIEVRDV